MRTIVFLLGWASLANAATYSYSTYNPSGAAFKRADLDAWQAPHSTIGTSNGAITCGTTADGNCQLYGTNASGGSLILTSVSQADYEERIGLTSATVSGGVVLYLHASSDALSTLDTIGDKGSFDALQIYEPLCATDGSCTAKFQGYERTNGVTSSTGFGVMPFWGGMSVRAVSYGSTMAILANDQFYALGTSLTGGYPGVGAWGTTGGSMSIAAIQVGPRCLTVPNPVNPSNVTISAYPTSVSMNWPETTQPAHVAAVGIVEWYTERNGSFYGQIVEAAAWVDPNVTPSSTYTYSVAPVSFHGVPAPYSPALTVKTPSALNVDPVRTGVKPLGSYWGSAPENIDMASGNLNLTIPLLRPQGRGGWSVPIALTYNSQIWKSDSAGIQNMGLDVGYGYGWKMLAGSLLPFWNRASLQIDHYLYTDATGGQYRLYPSGTTNIWVSHLYPVSAGLSGEGIYVYYDSGTNLLHFRDGSSWLMGWMSSGEEQDAGTLYPTVLEDRNGNEVIITYGPGMGTSLYVTSPTSVAINSSARIVSIEDTRATGTPRSTYNFTWYPPDGNGIQHLASIANTIGTSENYAFAIVQGLPFHDPWGGTVTAPYVTGLAKITNSSLNTSYTIFTDNSGQMLELQLPYGGYLRWGYGTNTYQWPSSANTIQLTAVNARFLAAGANSSNLANSGQAATEWPYPITYTVAPSNESVVAGSCVTDASAAAQRCWTFTNGGSTGVPVTTGVQRWGMVGGTMTKLQSETLVHALDGAGNPFVIQNLMTDFTAASGTLYSMTQQTMDAYGNPTSVSTWDYSTSTPSGRETRKVETTYKNNCASPWTGSTANDCPDVNAFLLSLPLQTKLTATVQGVTSTMVLATNTYDDYTKYGLPSVAGLAEFDTAYANAAPNTVRGDVTKTVTPGGTTNMGYDVTGMMLASDDNNGHAVNVSAAAGTNHSAPGTIQPSTGSGGDSSLATALSYTPFLAVSAAVAPNAATAITSYDAVGRVTSTQVPSHSTDGPVAGASTTYKYAFGTTVGGNITNGAYTTTVTTNTHWTTAVSDGLGRPVTETSGYGTATPMTVATVDTVYGPCACSPGGKMVKTSQPYAPGGTEVWTTYSYDFLGRTLAVTLPDGASQTKYMYQGNWTTVVDPAGKWKQYRSDVFGNVLNVVEPGPVSPPAQIPSPSLTAPNTLVTSYTYDGLNRLIGVAMPRGSVTQTRTFVYDPVTLRLTSMTSPETGTGAANGTTSYTYNADGTVATRTDPAAQVTKYTYDSYQRVTKVTHGPNASQTYVNQTYNYTYDTGTNGWGRLTGVTWGPLVGSNPTYSEFYSYTVAGEMSGKTLTAAKATGQALLSGSFAYDAEGKPTTVTYPGWGNSPTGILQSYTYDAMGRLTGMSNTEAVGAVGGCSPAPPASGTVNWASGAAYNAAGQLTNLTRLGSVASTCTGFSANYFNEHWQYNTLNQMTEIDTGAGNAMFARYNFSATANNGQVVSVDDARQAGANIAYTYDALKRLTKAATSSWTQNIGYDGFGNITSKDVPPNSAEPAFPGAISSKNRLTGVNYDLNGNALAVNAFALTYDVENRLATATAGTAVESYFYDEGNHRVEKSSGSGDSLYFYGPGGRLLSIRSVTQSGVTGVVADRMYFGGMLLGSAGTTGVQDASTMTDRLGTAAAGYPYGTDKGNAAGNDQPDFATYTKDGTTGFEYANQRYYSAGMGRFLTVDSFLGSVAASSSQSWNRYTYAKGDPLNGNDPTGREFEDVDVCADGGNLICFEGGTYGGGYVNQPVSMEGSEITVVATPDPVVEVESPTGVVLDEVFDSGVTFFSSVLEKTVAPLIVLTTPTVLNQDEVIWLRGGVLPSHNPLQPVILGRRVLPSECPPGQREPTPDNPGNQQFRPLRGTNCKVNATTGEIWCPDKLHHDHWEVYNNLKQKDNGRRNRSVYRNGCRRETFAYGF